MTPQTIQPAGRVRGNGRQDADPPAADRQRADQQGADRSGAGSEDPGNVFRCACPGREILDHITSRWGMLIIALLDEGPLRFFELRERIGGVSEKMLSQTLRTLTRDGLIERSVQATRPPKVSYRLSQLGHEAAEPLRHLVGWIADNTGEIQRAQREFDSAGS